ncbi:MAG: 4-(cytidine 5'-diphospho)-2-C-methyl-D-erythritol kinase [Planctomycetes bacterium]|nr:4-(cytidine 5'-diphospho)-2-C-methyl-D-erythritol kinase [Planctomycetota bacterium]
MTDTKQFEQTGERLLVRAPAKLNLSLLIAGKRPDGFHAIETIMAKVDWYDEIRIEPGRTAAIEFFCTGPRWAPQDQTNLVYRAAELILRETGPTRGVRLTLVKNIPAGSGLGSASSDAAATLLGLDRYLDLGLSRSRLMEMAARLGSDVAFFLHGPLAYCTGRGEQVTELAGEFPFAAVLILSDVNSSTREVYANYRHDPVLYEQLHAKITAFLDANRIDSVARMCANMLQRSCFQLYKELGERKQAIEALDIGPVCLSGSGSTMFLLFERGDTERVEAVHETLTRETGCGSTVVRNNQW